MIKPLIDMEEDYITVRFDCKNSRQLKKASKILNDIETNMHTVMTAKEINQLLIDRDIVILFNENIPCEEHDKTVKLLEKALKDETKDYEFKEYTLYPVSDGTLATSVQCFMDSFLTICNDIKNSDAHNQTILFNNGFIDLFVNLIGERSLIPLVYYTQTSGSDMISKFKTQLEHAYMMINYPDKKDYQMLKKYVTTLYAWNEIVSTILTCGHIHEITYYPENSFGVKKYFQEHDIRMSTDDFANRMFFNQQLAWHMESLLDNRSRKEGRHSWIDTASLNSYFRTETNLLLSPGIMKNIVERDTKK